MEQLKYNKRAEILNSIILSFSNDIISKAKEIQKVDSIDKLPEAMGEFNSILADSYDHILLQMNMMDEMKKDQLLAHMLEYKISTYVQSEMMNQMKKDIGADNLELIARQDPKDLIEVLNKLSKRNDGDVK